MAPTAWRGWSNFITHEPADFLTSAEGAPPKQVGGRISAGWSGDDNGRALAATVAGTASDTVQWLVTANARRSHAMDNMGTRDTSDTSRTTPNPQHNEDNAVLAKVVLRPSAAQRSRGHPGTCGKAGRRRPAVKPRAPCR